MLGASSINQLTFNNENGSPEPPAPVRVPEADRGSDGSLQPVKRSIVRSVFLETGDADLVWLLLSGGTAGEDGREFTLLDEARPGLPGCNNVCSSSRLRFTLTRGDMAGDEAVSSPTNLTRKGSLLRTSGTLRDAMEFLSIEDGAGGDATASFVDVGGFQFLVSGFQAGRPDC